MKDLPKIILVRHGETLLNKKEKESKTKGIKFDKWDYKLLLDPPLTSLGI